MGPSSRQTAWTAWAYGHPRKVAIDLLAKYVSKTRPQVNVQVATAVKVFTSQSLTKAIYGTGWDGAIVFEADVDGTWKKANITEGTSVTSGTGGTISTASSALLNINTASTEELTTLPLIGPGRASAIVGYRTANGPFGTVDDLGKVPGIGQGTINAVRSLVTTGN